MKLYGYAKRHIKFDMALAFVVVYW